MEDWEREYEEDRRRMAAGKDVGGGRRKDVEDDDPFRGDSRGAGGYVPPSIGGSSSSYGTNNTTAAPQPAPGRSDSSSGAPQSRKSEDDKIAELYSQYNDDAPKSMTGSAGAGASQVVDPSKGDARIGLNFVPLPGSLLPMFGNKIGKYLFYCERVTAYFKGFFSPNETPMYCFVTSAALYLGDEKTGELVAARSAKSIKEIQVLGDNGLGLRMDKVLDVFLTVPTNRSELVNVLSKVASACGAVFSTRTLSVEGEKTFRKEIKYADRKESSWVPEEDPRTGLALVEVPEAHQQPYAPICPKILHWFGGVFHIVKDWKGTNIQERRGCWLTATAIFLSKPTGPQVDGRDITRCMGIEFMAELVDGSEGALGLISDKDGPPQPHLALMFDTVELKRKMMYAIQNCYEFRKKTPIKVTKTLSLESVVRIEKEKDFKPHLFLMKTRQDLYGLLRGKTGQ